MTQHTPCDCTNRLEHIKSIREAFGMDLGNAMLLHDTGYTTKGNYAHIVHCVNTHEQLVAALERLFDDWTRRVDYDEERSGVHGMSEEELFQKTVAALAAAKKEVSA